ncbi:MAG: hypothetical protein K0R92_3211 [Lachnospiraceae bacterium]|jgi:hypothetical protein|nr:hypothetical protein [Lachnospiraceae bacterium]
MKRMRILLVMLFMFILTGCIQEYKVTEQQSNATAEYMAGLLLKYDENYMQGLISEEEVLQEEASMGEADAINPTPTLSPTEGATVSTEGKVADSEKDYTLTEVIGEKNFEIEYTGYKVTESYPEDTDSAYFSLTPREGNQLIVASFIVKNKSDKEKTLNLSKAKILYQLDVNAGTIYKPSLTLLENDLQYIDITIPEGEAEPVLLIFEVPEGTDMSDINLIVSNDKKTDIIKIK